MTPSRANILSQLIAEKGYKKGAEIGVDEAKTSSVLLSRHADLTLICVDSWGRNAFGEQVVCENYDYGVTEEKYKRVLSDLANYIPERAKILRMLSVEAAKLIKPRSLDFVFIDADHTYQGVSTDLKTWAPKVRKGGLIIGHDYAMTDRFPHIMGVARAVDDYFGAKPGGLYPDADLPGVHVWTVEKD